MAGASYLDDYGVSEERRNRVIRWILIGVAAAVVIGLVTYTSLEDYSETQKAKRFLQQVNARNYQAAYQEWGCTAQHPCPNYDYNRFLADWGPEKKTGGPWKIASSDSCKLFITVNVRAPGAEVESLSVQRSDNSLGYAPAAECQEPKWRWRQFFQEYFGSTPRPDRPKM